MKKINLILFIILILAIVGTVLFFMKGRSNSKIVKYPFFLSTKYSTTNIRSGPSEDFPIIWLFKEKNVPFKVVAFYKNWYQIQDYTGKVGWIFKNVTSQIKTAITKEKVEVYKNPTLESNRLAIIDPGIIVKVNKIEDIYVLVHLHISNINIKGWVLKDKLWGSVE